MKTTVRTFGRYEVKVNEKDLYVTISYVWSKNNKELFRENLTPCEALTMMRDRYMRKGDASYESVKAFLWPYIEQEF